MRPLSSLSSRLESRSQPVAKIKKLLKKLSAWLSKMALLRWTLKPNSCTSACNHDFLVVKLIAHEFLQRCTAVALEVAS